MGRARVCLTGGCARSGKVKPQRGASGAASSPPPPQRTVTRVGGTTRPQTMAPAAHTRPVSRSPQADNPGGGGRGGAQATAGKGPASPQAAGRSPSARARRPQPPASGTPGARVAHRTCTLDSPAPDGAALGGLAGGSRASRPGGPNSPGPRRQSACTVLARRRPPAPEPSSTAPLRCGRSPTCLPRPEEHRDIKY